MTLSTRERKDLQRHAGIRNGRAVQARPARLILLRPEGLTWAQIRAQLDCGDRYIARWSHRIAPDRLAELFVRSAGGARYTVTARIEASVLAQSTSEKSLAASSPRLRPHAGLIPWRRLTPSCRCLGCLLRLSQMHRRPRPH